MTTTTTTGERLLEMDTRGRVRTPAKRRKALLQEFAGSGLSARKFAALVGVRSSTFAHWVQRFREEGGDVAPVQSVGPVSPAAGPVQLAAQLLRALAEGPRPCWVFRAV